MFYIGTWDMSSVAFNKETESRYFLLARIQEYFGWGWTQKSKVLPWGLNSDLPYYRPFQTLLLIF